MGGGITVTGTYCSACSVHCSARLRLPTSRQPSRVGPLPCSRLIAPAKAPHPLPHRPPDSPAQGGKRSRLPPFRTVLSAQIPRHACLPPGARPAGAHRGERHPSAAGGAASACQGPRFQAVVGEGLRHPPAAGRQQVGTAGRHACTYLPPCLACLHGRACGWKGSSPALASQPQRRLLGLWAGTCASGSLVAHLVPACMHMSRTVVFSTAMVLRRLESGQHTRREVDHVALGWPLRAAGVSEPTKKKQSG